MSRLLGSAHIETLAREESVRGVLVRMVMEQAEQADNTEMALLENALQLLLTRFQVMGGDVS
jgi:hypothetical protein